MRGKIVYAGILAVTVYLNMLYHWELGNFVLAFEGMFLLLLLCNAGISWSGVSAEWKHTKLFVEEGEAPQSQIFVRNRLCIPVCKLRIDLSYQYAGEEKKRKERLWVAVRAKEKKQIAVKHLQKYSGKVCAELVDCRVYDVLGIWSFRKRMKKKAEILIFPKTYPIVTEVTVQTSNFSLEGERFSEEVSGDDPSELFALRDYQPGDRMARIHWKLSARKGEWYVKEFGQPGDRMARIHWKLSARKGEWYVKEFGRPVGTAVLLLLEPVWKEGGQSAAEISRYLQTAVSLVRSLLDAGCSHVVSWIMENGELERARIFTEEDVYLFAIRFLETWGAGKSSQESLTESYRSIYPQELYHTILSWRGEGGFFKNEEQIFAGHLIESQEWLRQCVLEV